MEQAGCLTIRRVAEWKGEKKLSFDFTRRIASERSLQDVFLEFYDYSVTLQGQHASALSFFHQDCLLS